jgi:hypothetical protein
MPYLCWEYPPGVQLLSRLLWALAGSGEQAMAVPSSEWQALVRGVPQVDTRGLNLEVQRKCVVLWVSRWVGDEAFVSCVGGQSGC